MAMERLRLDETFHPEDAAAWYRNAEVGDRILIDLPGRACALQLMACPNQLVCWWPEGGRGVSIPLEQVAPRLEMLSNVRRAASLVST